jgi:hypothetical protein
LYGGYGIDVLPACLRLRNPHIERNGLNPLLLEKLKNLRIFGGIDKDIVKGLWALSP